MSSRISRSNRSRRCDGRLEREFATRDLQLLDEIGGAGEQHPPAFLDQRQADRRGQVRFAAAGWAEQDQVGTVLEPAIAGAQRRDLRLGDHRHGVEVEVVQGLAGQQLRFTQMALDASTIPLGELVLGERREEASRRASPPCPSARRTSPTRA